MSEILDSGERTEFESGAVRDMKIGKGRFDLMPLDVVSELAAMKNDAGMCYTAHKLGSFLENGNVGELFATLDYFMMERQWTLPDMLLEVAQHFEQGALKYGENNWRKGIPQSSYVDSAMRHYCKWRRGDADEPHDRAFVWNILCLIWTVKSECGIGLKCEKS